MFSIKELMISKRGLPIIISEQLNAKVGLCPSTDVGRQGTIHRLMQMTTL